MRSLTPFVHIGGLKGSYIAGCRWHQAIQALGFSSLTNRRTVELSVVFQATLHVKVQLD
jgi:hypothetical protein